jgi:ATP-binding cassette, subfamily B, bacterial
MYGASRAIVEMLPRMSEEPRSAVREALRFVWRSLPRRIFALMVALQVVAGLVLSAELVLVGVVISALGKDSGHRATWGALGFGAVLVIGSVCTSASTELMTVVGERVQALTRRRLVSSALAAKPAELDSAPFYDEVHRASKVAGETAWSLAWGVVTFGMAVAGAAGAVAVLLATAPLLVPVLLVAGVLVWLIQRRTRKAAHQANYELTPTDREARYLADLMTSRSAWELRLAGAHVPLQRRLGDLLDMRVVRVGKAARRRFLHQATGSVVMALAATGVLLATVSAVRSGRVSVAAAGVAVLGVYQLQGRLRSLVSSINELSQSSYPVIEFQRFVEARVNGADDVGMTAAPFAGVRFEGVSFQYSGKDRDALTDINVEISPGEVVALVGENGSGKTTLVKLLCGLHEPSAGRIMWAETDMREMSRASLWSRVAVLFQDFVRYALSAHDNIALGSPESIGDHDAVARAAEMAGAAPVIEGLPSGYETRLGREFADGVDLSGGEWQRVALARTLMGDAGLIILDEPSAALDPRAEAEFFDRARQLAAGRTLLLISHRLTGVAMADRVIVLRDGRVVEDGTPDALRAAGGLFAELTELSGLKR